MDILEGKVSFRGTRHWHMGYLEDPAVEGKCKNEDTEPREVAGNF